MSYQWALFSGGKMRAFFINSRTCRYGEVNVILNEKTLDNFVGGAFVWHLVQTKGMEFMLMAEFGESLHEDGRLSVRVARGDDLCGNVLIVGFVNHFDLRDLTDDEVEAITDSITDSDGHPVFECGRTI